MQYVLIGIAGVAFVAFLIYIHYSSLTHRQKNENMKEENAHRDFSEHNPRSGQDMFRHRMK